MKNLCIFLFIIMYIPTCLPTQETKLTKVPSLEELCKAKILNFIDNARNIEDIDSALDIVHKVEQNKNNILRDELINKLESPDITERTPVEYLKLLKIIFLIKNSPDMTTANLDDLIKNYHLTNTYCIHGIHEWYRLRQSAFNNFFKFEKYGPSYPYCTDFIIPLITKLKSYATISKLAGNLLCIPYYQSSIDCLTKKFPSGEFKDNRFNVTYAFFIVLHQYLSGELINTTMPDIKEELIKQTRIKCGRHDKHIWKNYLLPGLLPDKDLTLLTRNIYEIVRIHVQKPYRNFTKKFLSPQLVTRQTLFTKEAFLQRKPLSLDYVTFAGPDELD